MEERPVLSSPSARRAAERYGREAARRIDLDQIAADTSELVRVPSITGNERAALQVLKRLAGDRGLESTLIDHHLDELRRQPGFPGGVAERSSLQSLAITLPGLDPQAPRFLVCGHIDVVPPGSLERWTRDPWSGEQEAGQIHGRGSVDMKGAVVACLHALAAIRGGGEQLQGDVVLAVVSSEEDGGQGAFGWLEHDHDFAGCLIPEPSGLAVASAHAGSIQLEGRVRGRTAHAANRLLGISAIDRYLPIHAAFADLEGELNAGVSHPLMRELELPYPVSVGRIEAGQWVSQVPDELRFQARVGVPVGSDVDEIWRAIERSISTAIDSDVDHVELSLLGAFRSASTDSSSPLVGLARDVLADELARPVDVLGVPWGADMQHVVAKGIPCVMVGTTGVERAHAADEWVDAAELGVISRTVARLAVSVAGGPK